MIRHQLPAQSPLSLSSLLRSSLGATLRPGMARASLGRYLEVRFHSPRVVLTRSGSEALQLALRMVDRRGGRPPEVLLPAYTCYDVATAAVGAGVRVRFYDIDPTTLAPDERSFREGLERGAAAAVVGNLYGYPVDWGTLSASCRESGAFLIEDAAQGLGSSWMGRASGTFGDVTVLSFGRGKGWTGGGGGALLVRGSGAPAPELSSSAPLADGLRSAGVSTAQWLLARPSLFGIPSAFPGLGLGETHFRPPTPPMAISAFSAALAFYTRGMAGDAVAGRRNAAKRLGVLLSPFVTRGTLQTVGVPEDGESGFLRFPLLLAPATTGDLGMAEAMKLGIARGYPRPLPDLPQVAGLMAQPGGQFPGAALLAKHLITLPTHSLLTPSDFQRIESLFSRFA